MKSLLLVVAVTLSTASVVSVFAYLFVGFSKPEILVRIVDQKPTPRSKATLILLLLSFFFCAFNAIRGAFWWMSESWGFIRDGEFQSVTISIASVLAVFAVALVPAIASSARSRVEQRIFDELLSGIEQILDNPYMAPRFRDAYQTRIGEDSAFLRQYWLRALRFADKVENLRASYVLEAQYSARADQRREEEFNSAIEDARRADEIAAEQLELSRERAKRAMQSALRLKARLFQQVNSIQWTIAASPGDRIGSSAALLLGELLEAQWNASMSAAEELLEPSQKSIRRGSSRPKSIVSLIGSLPGCCVLSEASITARYSGDQGGGWTRIEAQLGGRTIDIRRAIRFEESAEGIVSAMFVEFGLPTVGAFWHGLYGRDYQLPMSEMSFSLLLVEIFGSNSGKLEDLQIDRPAGIRAVRVDDRIQVACLGVLPTGSVDEFTLELDDGHVVASARESIFDSGVRMFY